MLQQKLDNAGNFPSQCGRQLATTDQKAEALAKKMVEDEQRINEVAARAIRTREGVSTLYGKVVVMHSGIEQTKRGLEEIMKHNDQEAPKATATLRRDAPIEIGTPRQERIAKFQELETAADLKKTEFQQWTAGFCIVVRDEILRQGGSAGGERGSSRADESSPNHDKKDLAVWK